MRTILPLIALLLAAALTSCADDNLFVEPTPDPTAGDHITEIRLGFDTPDTDTRVGINIDPSLVQDTYHWIAGDTLVLSEIDSLGVGNFRYSGNNYRYGITTVPAQGQPATFIGKGARQSGRYIVTHTRNWNNVSLPILSGALTYTLPPLIIQRGPLTDPAVAQYIADNLFWSTLRVFGAQLEGSPTSAVALDPQVLQIDVTVSGVAGDAAKPIEAVTMNQVTTNHYASAFTLAPATGAATGTAIAGAAATVATTVVADPAAPTVSSNYRVRLLARPVTPTSNLHSATVRIHSGPNYGATPATGNKILPLVDIQSVTRAAIVINTVIPTTAYAAADRFYIGAFWRAAQTGERIIRILADDAIAGVWHARVVWKNANWGAGDNIVLSTDPTTDPNVSFTDPAAIPADMNDPVNDALYTVNSSATSVSGYVASGSHIHFRMGITTPNLGATPRYAIVELRYGSPAKIRYLYLRQGEQPAQMSGHSNVLWSPFNVGRYNTPAQYGPHAISWFTAYPTQAGYFKSFSTNNDMWPPHTGAGWAASANASINNVCPDPLVYRAPSCEANVPGNGNIGYGTAANNITWGNTNEMGSLFNQTYAGAIPTAHPTLPNQPNLIVGYYADGYFDRHTIVNSPNNAVLTSVKSNDHTIAHMGHIIVNPTPTSKASLFFPATGYIDTAAGVLASGQAGGIWSSSQSAGNNGFITYFAGAPNFYTLDNGVGGAAGSRGYSIRCIRN